MQGTNDAKIRSAEQWSAAEETLRERHGVETLYVRKQAYRRGAEVLVVGGWAFLDGNPAVIPADLEVLVLTFSGADGELQTLSRDPATVRELLAPYLQEHEGAGSYFTARIPEEEKDALFTKLRALPDFHPSQGRSLPPASLNPPPAASPKEIAFPIVVGVAAVTAVLGTALYLY